MGSWTTWSRWFVLLAGVCASLALVVATRRFEHRVARERFERSAANRASALREPASSSPPTCAR